MTDEEKAEEYVKELILKHNRDVVLRPKNAVTYIDELKQAYLDGLAEGRKEKWHEIESHVKPSREISKKYMPKGKEKVLLKYHFYGDEEIHFSDGYYDPYDFEFHIPINPHGKIVCVIAWCELSTLEGVNMTRKEEAENYIIQKYRINENYRVDNEETRAYMRDDVHSDYQQEYELYLFGLNNGFDKGYHRQRERCDEEMKDLRNQFVLDGERIKQLGIENEALKQSVEEGGEIIAELKEQNKDLCESLDIMNNRESELLDQIEKMKCCSNCKHRTLYINGGTVMCYKDVVHEFGKPRQKCDKWECKE